MNPADDPNGAILDDDREYRYRLWRTITPAEQATLTGDGDRSTVAFVLLNPSTADETDDDRTLRRCTGYAERWGYDRLELVNLFAYRTKEPSELETVDDPFGPKNWLHIGDVCRDADRVVVGWGAHDIASTLGLNSIARCLRATRGRLYALGTTKDGHPRHPLYLPNDAEPERWFVEAALPGVREG